MPSRRRAAAQSPRDESVSAPQDVASMRHRRTLFGGDGPCQAAVEPRSSWSWFGSPRSMVEWWRSSGRPIPARRTSPSNACWPTAPGMIGFPLRLLAREIYDRIVAIKGKAACALITGEEKLGARGRALSRLHGRGDADAARGGVPRHRRDPARGRPRARPRLHRPAAARARQRGDDVPGLGHDPADPEAAGARGRGDQPAALLDPVLSPATASCTACRAAAWWSRSRRPRSTRWPRCIRRQKGGAAVVLGALSPRTRNAQVAMYQAGEVEHLVATDAIGMGLNMDVAHVAFAQPRQVRRHRAAAPAARPRWRRSPAAPAATWPTAASAPPMAASRSSRARSRRSRATASRR